MLETIRIEEKILGRNDDLADENRRRFDAAGTFVITLSGSPGGGKTSLLERVVPRLRDTLRVAVVEGDVETERDGRRIAALGVPVTQIVTNGTCHLNAGMVGRALQHTALDGIDLLFLENVGNLVCPAAYGLGEHLRVVVMSMTEGEDKPLKYPAMFRKADAMVLNKIDSRALRPCEPGRRGGVRSTGVAGPGHFSDILHDRCWHRGMGIMGERAQAVVARAELGTLIAALTRRNYDVVGPVRPRRRHRLRPRRAPRGSAGRVDRRAGGRALPPEAARRRRVVRIRGWTAQLEEVPASGRRAAVHRGAPRRKAAPGSGARAPAKAVCVPRRPRVRAGRHCRAGPGAARRSLP